ncbi:MAG: hypothetical protein KAJ19_05105 [Gammaproteobacteria bacterium]|nr:hypothetical protein [Gammaproteobacteria bacterium]
MPIHEYMCENGHITEDVSASQSEVLENVVCKCGLGASRIISAPHYDSIHIPKLINEKHNHRISLMREQLTEKNYKEAKRDG